MLYGYFTPSGYMGLVSGRWMLFSTETDYIDYLQEGNNEQN